MQVHKRAQRSAEGTKEYKRALPRKKRKQPGVGTPNPSVTFGVSFVAVFLGHSLCTQEEEFYCLQRGVPRGFFRAARVQNETAPEKNLNRYEKRFEKREKGSEKRSETRLKIF